MNLERNCVGHYKKTFEISQNIWGNTMKFIFPTKLKTLLNLIFDFFQDYDC